MKFSQLAVGQRFRLDAEAYVKTGPLTANHQANGTQRLVARAARVELMEDPVAAGSVRAQELLRLELAAETFAAYHAQCLELLEELAPQLDDSALGAARERAEEAGRRCMEALTRAAASGS